VGKKLKIMKKIFITLFLFSGLLFVSCENEDTANVSRVTNYPLISVNGDDPIFVKKGDTYTDPGAIATEGGSEIPFTTVSSGNYRGASSLNTNLIDSYSVIYTATNKDGFKASGTRTVWVYNNGDLINSIEGIYTSTVLRGGASSAQYTDMEYVLIWKNEDGTYQMSDGLGGYYNIGRNYGVTYAAGPAIITANNIATNDFSVTDYAVGLFGGNAVVSGFTVDPVAKTISFTSTWDGSSNGTFKVTLTQVQP
jgi:hypothetical protein